VRRGSGAADGTLHCEGVELDPARHIVVRDEEPVELTAKEFQILHRLIGEPDRVFSRSEIVAHVYDEEHDGSSNTIDVLIGRIRKKLRTAERATLIRTVRGVGYSFRGTQT
jgi:two-component system response regulator PhoP